MEPLVVDAHEDLAWNALIFGRDYTRSALATRLAEENCLAAALSGHTLLGLPEYLQGRVAVVFGTLFVPPTRLLTGRKDDVPAYANASQAHNLYARQLEYYHRLAAGHPQFVLVGNRSDLELVLASWKNDNHTARRVGLVPLMEGADCIRGPADAEWWMEQGLRIVGLA